MDRGEVKLQVTIPDDAWEEDGDGWEGRLAGPALWINGVPHHVSAIRVVSEGGLQEPQGGRWTMQEYAAMHNLYEADGAFYETEIGGEPYVINIVPFKD